MANNILSNKNIELLEGLGTPLADGVTGPKGSIYVDRTNAIVYVSEIAGSSAGWLELISSSTVPQVGATNGLSLSSGTTGDVKLGGTLNQNTVIDGSYDLTIRSHADEVFLNTGDVKGGLAWAIGSTNGFISASMPDPLYNQATFGSLSAKELITIQVGASGYGANRSASMEINSGGVSWYQNDGSSSDFIGSIDKNGFTFVGDTGSPVRSATLKTQLLSSDRSYEMPDSDGTIALQSDISLQGALDGGVSATITKNPGYTANYTMDGDGAEFLIDDPNAGSRTTFTLGTDITLRTDNLVGGTAVALPFGAVTCSKNAVSMYKFDASNDRAGISIYDTSPAINIIDQMFGYGAVYEADYSSTFINESLVSKRYVDNQISSSLSGSISGATSQVAYFDSANSITGSSNYTFDGTTLNVPNLIVGGTTTTVNSTVVSIEDPIFVIGGTAPQTIDDNKDRGIQFNYNNGSTSKYGFFGFDESDSRFKFIPDATNTSEVITGSVGDVEFNNIYLTGPTAASTLTHNVTTSRTWTLPDNSGTVALTSDIIDPSGTYLPLAGGTMTGDINFTNTTVNLSESSGEFSINVADSQLYFDGSYMYWYDDVNDPSTYTTFLNGSIENQLGANGSYLLLNNITATRTWTMPDATGTVALTTDIPDVAIGGTVTGASQGSIFFGGTGGNLQQDNDNLFWDDSNNRLGIGTTAPEANLNVVGSSAGGVVFKVDGTAGELFNISDSLTGVLFSVNNISGLPVLEVEDTDEVRLGNYIAPAGFTTNKVITGATGPYGIHNVDMNTYDMATFDYVVIGGTNYRAGNIQSVWDGSNFDFYETSTNDIGDTSPITFDFDIGNTAYGATATDITLVATTTSGTWTIKTIIKTI